MAKELVKDINSRVNQIDMTGDSTVETLVSTIEDHDEAILHYMNNVIRPQIVQDGKVLHVNTTMGNRELWESIQSGIFYRDKNEKLTVPMIVLNRESVVPDRTFIQKIGSNLSESVYTITKPYTKEDPYTRFNSKTDIVPRNYYNIIVPDYVVITYSGIILTNYMENMNSVISSLIFANNSYWGKEFKQYKVVIDGLTNTSEITTDTERIIRNEFTLTVNGRLFSNTMNRMIVQQGKAHKIQKVKIVETVVKL